MRVPFTTCKAWGPLRIVLPPTSYESSYPQPLTNRPTPNLLRIVLPPTSYESSYPQPLTNRPTPNLLRIVLPPTSYESSYPQPMSVLPLDLMPHSKSRTLFAHRLVSSRDGSEVINVSTNNILLAYVIFLDDVIAIGAPSVY